MSTCLFWVPVYAFAGARSLGPIWQHYTGPTLICDASCTAGSCTTCQPCLVNVPISQAGCCRAGVPQCHSRGEDWPVVQGAHGSCCMSGQGPPSLSGKSSITLRTRWPLQSAYGPSVAALVRWCAHLIASEARTRLLLPKQGLLEGTFAG